MTNYLKKILYLVVAIASFSAFASDTDDFFRAARADNASGIQRLLARGFDPNTRDEKGQTALLVALREPSPKVIEVLVAFPKTDVEARNDKDESPLMLAAIKGQQELVSKLIAREADINKPGWTPLHYAATGGHVAIMKQLLDKDAFINAQSPNGTTPLMMAAMYGSAEAVKLLLEEGADLDTKNQQGMTAADFASRGKRPDALELLKAAGAASGAPKRRADGKW